MEDITVKQLLLEQKKLEQDLTELIRARRIQFETTTGIKVAHLALGRTSYNRWPDYVVSVTIDIYDQPGAGK